MNPIDDGGKQKQITEEKQKRLNFWMLAGKEKPVGEVEGEKAFLANNSTNKSFPLILIE